MDWTIGSSCKVLVFSFRRILEENITLYDK